MGESHEYWCSRCGKPAPVTVYVRYHGVGEMPLPMKAQTCNSVDCVADVLERHAARLRQHSAAVKS